MNGTHLFPKYWIGGSLGSYRACDSTYEYYDWDALPTIDVERLDGSFRWLQCQPHPIEFDERYANSWANGALDSWRRLEDKRKTNLQFLARSSDIRVPQEFIAFMCDTQLVTRVRSPTDCYFHHVEELVPNPLQHGGYFVHFMSDSQNCFEWYLHVARDRKPYVVASSEMLDELEACDATWHNDSNQIVTCGETFESFIYRLWIENEIWYRLVDDHPPLTEEMEDYLFQLKQ